MNRLFGTGSRKPPPTLTDSISNIESRIDQTNVRILKLDAELQTYKDKLRNVRNPAGRKPIEQRALRVLQQRKMYEDQRDRLERQRGNMEQTSMTTDSLKDTMASVQVMQAAGKEMKRQHKKINIDEIENMRDDMEDLLEQSNDIQEALGQSYGVPDDVNELDLQAELDALGDDLKEDEAEIPSYLKADTTELPDFVDEPPQAESSTANQPLKEAPS